MTTTTWNIDPAHTDIQFSARHMMVTTVRGKFGGVDGSLVLDEDDPTQSHGSFVVRTASVNSGVERRDDHLRSPDFLDAERYPVIAFVSTAIEPRSGDDYRVTGDLTIRDVTRPVTFDVTFLGLFKGLNGARRAGFRGTTTLDREAWGLTWNVALETGGWLVGKDIRLEIDVAVEEAQATETAPAATRTAA